MNYRDTQWKRGWFSRNLWQGNGLIFVVNAVFCSSFPSTLLTLFIPVFLYIQMVYVAISAIKRCLP